MYKISKKLMISGIASLLATTLYAGEVTIPNTFTANTKAKASEVNANFTAVKNAINENRSDIIKNKNKISTLENNLTKQASTLESKTKQFTDISFYKIDNVELKDPVSDLSKYTNVGYVNIQVPSDGYIHVLATGYINISSNNKEFYTEITIALTTDETLHEWSYDYNNTISYKSSFISPTTNNIQVPYSIQGVFPVTKGTHEFFVMAYESSTASPGEGASLLNNYVTATYFIGNK